VIIDNRGRTRLYRCWDCMKTRANARKDCKVSTSWLDFQEFKKWSLLNGYSDTKVICRNGDKGDYSSTNSRWDTQASNVSEALSMKYKALYEGEVVEIYNLALFCRDNKLDRSGMTLVLSGRQKSHRGYTKYEEEQKK
jgi:hypothetical protein